MSDNPPTYQYKLVEGATIPILKITNIGNKMSEWSMDIANGAIVINIPEGKLPNRFHRLMQRLILGIKWIKK